MEWQNIIDTMMIIISGAVGWVAKEIWNALTELKNDLAMLKADLPKLYVLREDYKQDIRDIKEMVGKIFDKLDHKADKSG